MLDHAGVQRRAAARVAAAAFVLATAGECAQADSRLVAHYRISVAHIAVGTSAIEAVVGGNTYTAAASGRASGVMRIVVSGEGFVSVRGAVVDGRLVPERFRSRTSDEDEKAEVVMTLDDGNVTGLSAESTASDDKRVPLAPEHRRGILDPLSALLIDVPGERDPVDAEACRRMLPIFDGRRRFDLALAFKRIESVKAYGFAGPAVVCAVVFRAIAGHRADSALVKYLADGRDIELALAPIAGTRLLAPFRLSVSSMLGDMVIAATSFEVRTAPASGVNAP